MMEITITPQGAGRFEVRLGDHIILKSSRQPVADAARVLVGEGIDPKARIQMRHEGSPHVALSSTIGKAARLTVAERDNGNGPVFEPWKPRPLSAGAPPMRSGGDEAPGIALQL
jgi:hypothetical protein